MTHVLHRVVGFSIEGPFTLSVAFDSDIAFFPAYPPSRRKILSPVATDQKRPLKTLERVLSKAGVGSRSQARSWIHAGRVTVNGQPTQNPDQWVDPDLDDVQFDAKPLPRPEPRYVLLHKPAGYLTTRRDPDGRPTVFDLTSGLGQTVSYVGRLDLDTSGLLLLTNDNALAEHLTNPEHHVPKTYVVEPSTWLSDDQLQQLRDGVSLDDGPTRPAQVSRVHRAASPPDGTCIEITITEGRNRQVRRMVEALGAQVRSLVRTCIGPIQLGDLPVGRWRDLAPDEVRALQRRHTSQSAIG